MSPATASSQAQFSATGMYNADPTTVNITSTTNWCVGNSSGFCAGNIAVGATVNGGAAQCLPGFSGTATIIAGQGAARGNPDGGYQLMPFGTAELNCP